MLLPTILLALVFLVLLGARLAGARRGVWLGRWPAILLAVAALVALLRGALWPALGMAALAVVIWQMWPQPAPESAGQRRRSDPADTEAEAILGVGADATETEIRRAFRARMVRAHPDHGGGHAEAARLTAARDRLLKRARR